MDEAEVLVADTSGESVDNKTRLELIRQQEQLIKKEAEEKEIEVSYYTCKHHHHCVSIHEFVFW